MRKITRYYTESRYPVGYEVEYTKEEIEESLDKAKEIIALIKEKIK
jgi:HEPN domain-containing protein